MGKLPGLWKRFPAAAGGVAGRGMLWRYRSAGPVPTASGLWNSGRRWQAKVGEDEEILYKSYSIQYMIYIAFNRPSVHFWDVKQDLVFGSLWEILGGWTSRLVCAEPLLWCWLWSVVMSVLLECPASQYELLHPRQTLVHFSTHRKRLLIILQTQSQTMQTWRPSFLNLECLGCTIVLPSIQLCSFPSGYRCHLLSRCRLVLDQSQAVQNSSSEIRQVSGIRLQSGSLSQERGGGKDSAPEQPLWIECTELASER